MQNKFYITTPIYYVNAEPHIGHAYTTIAADVLARYWRMIGAQVFFLTGTDEHGAKIAQKAQEAGQGPRQFADVITAKFCLAWDELNISHNSFIRTTEKKHIKAAQKALRYMRDKGDIYLGKYEGLYCRGCEQYKNEKDLINGFCPDHKKKPEKIKEESYIFKLSKYKDELLERIKNDELEIKPKERRNEVISFYENEGLNDVSFSRENVSWGVPLPWDKKHTAYVWADAFLNYLTGLDWDGEAGKAPKLWPADVQLMSKDILRVHATIWPAMLLSLGLPLPEKLFIHGFFQINGQKMSKSLGNVIAPDALVKKYGVDATRYLLMSAAPFGQDGDISWSKFDEKYNADLANGLGNLVARSVTLAENMEKFNLKIQKTGNKNIDEWGDDKFSHSVEWDLYKEVLERFEISHILYLVFGMKSDDEYGMIKFLDNYITSAKPWELIKNKDERVGVVMYNILEKIRHIAWMIWPFMPDTAEKIWESLGLDAQKEMNKEFEDAIKWGGLDVGAKVKKSTALFPRI